MGLGGGFGGGGGVMGDAGVFGGIADPKQQLQVTEPYNRNCTKPWGNGKENRCRILTIRHFVFDFIPQYLKSP